MITNNGSLQHEGRTWPIFTLLQEHVACCTIVERNCVLRRFAKPALSHARHLTGARCSAQHVTGGSSTALTAALPRATVATAASTTSSAAAALFRRRSPLVDEHSLPNKSLGIGGAYPHRLLPRLQLPGIALTALTVTLYARRAAQQSGSR